MHLDTVVQERPEDGIGLEGAHQAGNNVVVRLVVGNAALVALRVGDVAAPRMHGNVDVLFGEVQREGVQRPRPVEARTQLGVQGRVAPVAAGVPILGRVVHDVALTDVIADGGGELVCRQTFHLQARQERIALDADVAGRARLKVEVVLWVSKTEEAIEQLPFPLVRHDRVVE